MTRSLLALGAAFLVGLTGCDSALDTAAAPAADASPIVHRVTVGSNDFSNDDDPQPDDANFSVSVIQFANGTVRGMHNDVIRGDNDGDGRSDTTFAIRATIDCLRVVGTTAIWSGTITSPGPTEGWTLLSAARDLGTSPRDATDQISFSYQLAPSRMITCNTPGLGLAFFDIVNGQVRIQ